MKAGKEKFWIAISVIGGFPKWSRIFIEFSDFSEFGESDKSLKHELGSIERSCLSHGAVVASWFHTQEVAGSSLFNEKYFFNGNI